MKILKPIDVLLSLVYSNLLDDEIIKRLLQNTLFLKKTLRLASINGLFYLFLNELKEREINIPSYLERFEEELKKLNKFKKTIDFLNRITKSSSLDYMIIKACVGILHVPRDIDILVHKYDKHKILKKLQEAGFTCSYQTNVETSYQKEGYLKIDIYTGVRYLNIDFIDGDYLWDSCIIHKTSDIAYPTLRNEANILLMLVHSLYGHRSMSLLDFIYIDRILKKTDIDMCREYAKKWGWKKTFEMILNRFKKLQNSILSDDLSNITFPYHFNSDFILKSISQLKKADFSRKTTIFLHISFLFDRILHEMQKTEFYDSLSNNQWIRKRLNSFNYFIRHGCGDDKSM